MSSEAVALVVAQRPYRRKRPRRVVGNVARRDWSQASGETRRHWRIDVGASQLLQNLLERFIVGGTHLLRQSRSTQVAKEVEPARRRTRGPQCGRLLAAGRGVDGRKEPGERRATWRRLLPKVL